MVDLGQQRSRGGGPYCYYLKELQVILPGSQGGEPLSAKKILGFGIKS